MKTLKDYISESIIVEAITIDSENSYEFSDFMNYVLKYSKSLKIGNEERKRYEKKGTPITKEIAQELLSKRLYNNVSVRYKTDKKFFIEVCKKGGITVNMSNLGFGKDEVIEWIEPEKKIDQKYIYFDDNELVWYDKTIAFSYDDGGIKILPEYEKRSDEILSILNKKFKATDWYIVK